MAGKQLTERHRDTVRELLPLLSLGDLLLVSKAVRNELIVRNADVIADKMPINESEVQHATT